MALLEADLKRRLAFVTMCHGGIVLMAFAKRSPEALAGGAVYVLADGLAKAALFGVAGILLDRFGSEALDRLHGRGKGMWLPGLTFVLGGLALTGCPPFGTALGREAIQQASSAGGLWWLEVLGTVAEIIAGVAVLGAAGRIFLGWRSAALPATGAEGGPAEEGSEAHASPWMTVLCVLLIAGSLAVGLCPGVMDWAKAGARTFTDPAGYGAAVLLGARLPAAAVEMTTLHVPTAPSAWLPTLIAVLLTGLGALRGRFVSRLRGAVLELLAAPLRLLRGLQSGLLADYVVWTCVGTVTLYVCLRVWLT
jgi:multicomponent Na+:H+ antiporter subunit D